MKTRVTDNGIFFFREEKDGTKKQFLELIEKLNKGDTFKTNLDQASAGNIAVLDFIKKYSKKLNQLNEGNQAKA